MNLKINALQIPPPPDNKPDPDPELQPQPQPAPAATEVFTDGSGRAVHDPCCPPGHIRVTKRSGLAVGPFDVPREAATPLVREFEKNDADFIARQAREAAEHEAKRAAAIQQQQQYGDMIVERDLLNDKITKDTRGLARAVAAHDTALAHLEDMWNEPEGNSMENFQSYQLHKFLAEQAPKWIQDDTQRRDELNEQISKLEAEYGFKK